MIGNLYQWMSEMSETYLKEFEECSSTMSYNRMGSRMKTDFDATTNAKYSLDTISYNKVSIGDFRSPSAAIDKLMIKPTGFLLGPN